MAGFLGWPATNQDTVTVAATTTSVLDKNTKRKDLVLENNGAVHVWINFGAAAEVGKGLKLRKGGALVFTIQNGQEDGWQRGAVHGIAESGTCPVAIFEVSTS
jgi:hypothetical protein